MNVQSRNEATLLHCGCPSVGRFPTGLTILAGSLIAVSLEGDTAAKNTGPAMPYRVGDTLLLLAPCITEGVG